MWLHSSQELFYIIHLLEIKEHLNITHLKAELQIIMYSFTNILLHNIFGGGVGVGFQVPLLWWGFKSTTEDPF